MSEPAAISETLLQEAQDAQRAGRTAEAARLYHEILRTQPRHFEALYRLGLIYFYNGQNEQAQTLFGEALKLDPLFLDVLCLRGIALAHLRRHSDAIASFDRAISIKPDFIEALSGRATTYLEILRLPEAMEGFDRVLAIDPNHAITWNNRGNALFNMDRFEEAIANYERALAIQPDFAKAVENRALVMAEMARTSLARRACERGLDAMQAGRWDDALTCLDEAITAKPNYLEALTNRGVALLELKQFGAALAAFDAALEINPHHAIGWNNRANTLIAMDRRKEAIASYDEAIRLQPDFDEAQSNREKAIFELEGGPRCPPRMMRRLFDHFSSHYDETMLEQLFYRAHLHLRTLAERVLPRMTPPWRILDLGSGTGLVGEAFKDLAAGGRLDGIDIAPRMIDAARQRGIYDELILGDLETVLMAKGPAYDLMLAADTMIYLGDLSITLAGAERRLEPGGYYLFAVESRPGEGWEQTPANRFRHSEAYLREAAAKAGLDFIGIQACVLRREGRQAVAGFAVAVQKPQS